MKRGALFYGQRTLNKGGTQVLRFPFATLCNAQGFLSKQSINEQEYFKKSINLRLQHCGDIKKQHNRGEKKF